MSPTDGNGRPAKETARPTNTTNTTRVLASTDAVQDFADAVDGTFVVLVRRPGNRFHRRCMLTLRAAEHAAALAIARGESVEILMAELRPLYRIKVVSGPEAS